MESTSFCSFLSAFGEANPPSLCYREGDDFAGWQRRFRQALESLRGPVPERVLLEVEILEVTRGERHTRTLLRAPVTRFTTLIAYLLVPDGLAPGERRPGLLALQGHDPYGIDAICGVRGLEEPDGPERAYGLAAVKAGYVVLAPAWWGWAGRDGHLPLVGQRDRCNVIQMAAAMYGLNVLDLHVQDGQAALDVLQGRPEVDPERLGCLGNSYGGRTSMWLSVLDERIRACVLAGCMNTFRERSLKLSSCAIQYLPGLLCYGDVPEVLSQIAPRPMQLQAGALDPLITPEDRDAMAATVRRAYALFGAEAHFEYLLHPEGHVLKWDAAQAFLGRHLG